MRADVLGDRVKAFEQEYARPAFKPSAYLMARVDGRAFHTFTKGMSKPADPWLMQAMLNATIAVTADLKPRLAYTQSDETTFCWHETFSVPGADLPFGGRVQKLVSVIAGVFSAAFIDSLVKADLPRYVALGKLPAFDCRVWEVPSAQDQLEAFLWREKDAVKNAISSAASTVATEKELDGLRQREREALLSERGFDWASTPAAFKRGAYVRRVTRYEPIDPEILAKIPEAKRPALVTMVVRHSVQVDPQFVSVQQLDNPEEFFFGVEPKLRPL